MLLIHRNYPEFYITYQNAIIVEDSKHNKDTYISLTSFELSIIIVLYIKFRVISKYIKHFFNLLIMNLNLFGI